GSYRFENLVKGHYDLTFDPDVFLIDPKTGVGLSYFLNDKPTDSNDVDLQSDQSNLDAEYTLGDESVPPSVVRPRFNEASRLWDNVGQSLAGVQIVPQLAAFQGPIDDAAEVAETEVLWLERTKLTVRTDTSGFLLSTLGFRLRDNTARVRGALEGLIANL